MNIKFPREYYALGRNGDFKQVGLIVKHKKRKANKPDADIAFYAMKADGSPGAHVIHLPMGSIDTLINQLTKIKAIHEGDFLARDKKIIT